MAKESKKINIEDFFVTSNEKKGVWYEPKIEGNGIGIEFKILGYSSDENILSADQYTKDHEVVEAEKDPVKKVELEREAVCKRVGSIITDIRGKDGDIYIGDEPLKYSKEVVYRILYENIEIRSDLFRASFETTNFMKKK